MMIPAETMQMVEREAADRSAAKDATIADLRNALAFVKAERDHWHRLVPSHQRVQFPFDIKAATVPPSTQKEEPS